MTIEAMQKRSADHDGHKLTLSICAIDLEHIIEDMIRDGVARQKKGGKYSRTVCTSTMSGFLFQLGRYIAGSSRRLVRTSAPGRQPLARRFAV
jgi:hypothetical protein